MCLFCLSLWGNWTWFASEYFSFIERSKYKGRWAALQKRLETLAGANFSGQVAVEHVALVLFDLHWITNLFSCTIQSADYEHCSLEWYVTRLFEQLSFSTRSCILFTFITRLLDWCPFVFWGSVGWNVVQGLLSSSTNITQRCPSEEPFDLSLLAFREMVMNFLLLCAFGWQ